MGINAVLELHEKAEEGQYQRSMEEREEGEQANHYLQRHKFLNGIEKDLRAILGKFDEAEQEGLIGPRAEEVRGLIEKAYGVI